MVALIDGENLTFRYQAMLEAEDGDVQYTPFPYVHHIRDSYVWCNGLIPPMRVSRDPFLRVSYFTSTKQHKVSELNQTIAERHQCSPGWDGCVVPRVFIKNQQDKKTKAIDIAICIEAMHYIKTQRCEDIVLVSGDGDYIPLIKELMRNGIRVHCRALSSGCKEELKFVSDSFEYLDSALFQNAENKGVR
ncbi:NYN domain-containing protein [bacterium]|nr:NYN domain-containing protein [bacterium]